MGLRGQWGDMEGKGYSFIFGKGLFAMSLRAMGGVMLYLRAFVPCGGGLVWGLTDSGGDMVGKSNSFI